MSSYNGSQWRPTFFKISSLTRNSTQNQQQQQKKHLHVSCGNYPETNDKIKIRIATYCKQTHTLSCGRDCKNKLSTHLWGGPKSRVRVQSQWTELRPCLPWPPLIWPGPCPQHFWDGWVGKAWGLGDGVWKAANSSSLDSKNALCYQSLEGGWHRRKCAFTAHTGFKGLLSFLRDLESKGVERSFGEERWNLTVFTEVKLYEFMWFENVWRGVAGLTRVLFLGL